MESTLPPYRIVSCSFRDVVEAAATLRTECSIVIWNEQDAEETLTGVIRDVYTQKGAEYLVMNGGKTIRLDRIASLNGVSPNQC